VSVEPGGEAAGKVQALPAARIDADVHH